MSDLATIADRLRQIQQRITAFEAQYQQAPGKTRLLAVSKGHSVAAIREAYAAGQRAFGESYVQEALVKIRELADLNIEWHFIGRIQSNKTRDITRHFSWVHSVDRFSIAQRLSEQRPAQLAPLNVCLQINISHEANKSGITLAELAQLAGKVSSLPRIHLRGLMALPQARAEFAEQRHSFQQLRQAFDQLRATGQTLDTLSMGMSDDLEAAIAEASTLVRIGTAIFGERTARIHPTHKPQD